LENFKLKFILRAKEKKVEIKKNLSGFKNVGGDTSHVGYIN